MSQKAPNGDATGASKEQEKEQEQCTIPMCIICRKSTSYLLSCCGYPLCKSCFDGIIQHYADKTKQPICPSCREPIMALIPIVPILKSDGNATG